MATRLLLLVAMFGAGCATAGRGASFPTKSALEALAKQRPSPVRQRPVATVDAWTLAGPLPTSWVTRAHVDATPAEAAVGALAPAQALRSEAMHCVARELGRFALAHGDEGWPDAPLQAFIEGACGTVDGTRRMNAYAADVGARSDDEVLVQFAPAVRQLYAELARGAGEVGAWYGRQGTRALVMIAAASPRVRIDAGSPLPDANGRVVLQGEVKGGADRLWGVATRGRFGLSDCEAGDLPLPKFAVRCFVSRADPRATIELSAHDDGRILGRSLATVVAWPSGAPGLAWRREAPIAPLRAEEPLHRQLAGAVNVLRAEAGLAPLALAEGQSDVANRTAPHYFGAIFGGQDQGVVDTVALGMMAGWDVKPSVREGSFVSAARFDTTDLGQLLEEWLRRPSSRRTLLARESKTLAVGAVWNERSKFLGAIVATYELAEKLPVEALSEQVYRRIDALRLDAGKPAARRIDDLREPATRIAGQLEERELDPFGARARLARDSVWRVPRGRISTWIFEATRPEKLRLPEELLDDPTLAVAVGAATYRVEGDPWTRTMVLLVSVAPQGLALAEALPGQDHRRR